MVHNLNGWLQALLANIGPALTKVDRNKQSSLITLTFTQTKNYSIDPLITLNLEFVESLIELNLSTMESLNTSFKTLAANFQLFKTISSTRPYQNNLVARIEPL
jgi:hypothetical protein